MKKIVLLLFLIGFLMHGFAQQATIDGSVCASAPDCPKYVCENSTIDLLAGITVGSIDSLYWRERVWDGSTWGVYQTVGTNVTIIVPVTEPATVGHVYRYQLIVYQGGNPYFALADMYVNASPTATLLSDYTTICAGSDVTFTASAGGSNYDFMVNGTSAQNGVSSTFVTSALADGDDVTVAITNVNGCFDTSIPITMTVNAIPTVTSVTGNSVPGCVGELVPVEIVGLTGVGPWYLEVFNDVAGSPSTLYYDIGSVTTSDATVLVPIGTMGFDNKHLKITDINCSNF